MARLVLATYGSLGDLHPVLALALELRRRGHLVALATTENYREKIRRLDFAFHALRPDLLAGGDAVIAEIMDGTRGTTRLMRDRMFPAIREMQADLAAATAGAELLVASELVFVAPILAASAGLPWISYCLAPASLLSADDPPVLPLPRGLGWLPRLGPAGLRFVMRAGRIVSHRWWRPVRTLRRELGLPPGGHPLFEGKFSARLNLALFSPVLQPPQADWPDPTVQTGFLFFDEGSEAPAAAPAPAFALPAPVEAFLQGGEPPLIFTLGSAAIYVAGNFYREAVRAATRLGRRALLLLGGNPPPPDLPPAMLAWDYLPYAAIFPRAAAIVHQGGVGTTAQALRAGRPMVVVPFAHDQFDNAARVTRLGVARTLGRSRLNATNLAWTIAALLADSGATKTAADISARIRTERGAARAAEAIERSLPGTVAGAPGHGGRGTRHSG